MSLPRFSEVQASQVLDHLKEKLDRGRSLVDRLTSDQVPATWQEIIEPLESFEIEFGNFWSPISHLWSVMNTPELSEAFQAALPMISDFDTEIGQNRKLFKKYQTIAASPEFEYFTSAQKKLVENGLRDFKLSGIGLADAERDTFKALNAELSQLQAKFEQNLLDAGNAWERLIEDVSELKGVPESSLGMFRAAAKSKGKEGWLITLDIPFYLPVMKYAENRELRYELYRAYNTRASEYGMNPDKWDNSATIGRVMNLRHEMAKLLSFHNFSELSLATKMAETPVQVLDFLDDLAKHSHRSALEDMQELKGYISKIDPAVDCQPWDIPFYSEKLKQEKFQFSSEEVRSYFPLPSVLHGLFQITQRLFGVEIRACEGVELWHEDAGYYEVLDPDKKVRGGFYLDLYARPKKRGGAWMDTCRDRISMAGETQNPVAYLVCNFSPPVGKAPSLLTHEEVMTIFHEFGHGLHHLLTKVDYPSVAGISGVPWDAVELPSQFLENWCWQAEALELFSSHVETGETLPPELLKKMKLAKNFQAGMQMVRQIEFSLFDFLLHLEYNAESPEPYLQVLNRVREQVSVVSYPEWNRFPNAFHHVFGGGYAAGYYSYKWAEVLSADAFSLFEEKGVFDKETGRSFAHHILEKGGSEPAMDLFKAFRGRAPKTDALLKDCGFR